MMSWNVSAMINVTKLLCGTPRTAGAGDGEWVGASGSERNPAVVWNITRRCNLKCLQCYSDSSTKHFPGELTLEEMVAVVDDLSGCGIRTIMLSGGEPMLHPHFFDVAGYAVERGVRVSVFSNGSRINSHAAERLKDLGVGYVGLSLDGINGDHDAFRGRPGAFKKTVDALRHCRGAGQKAGLRIKISKQNVAHLPEILSFIEEEEIPSICFCHPVISGRGAELGRIPAATARTAMRMIADAVLRWNREGSTREVLTVDQPADAIFYWLRMKRRDPKRAEEIWKSLNRNGNKHGVPGLGIANIDSQGDVHANQFWDTHTLGNVKEKPFSTIWESSQNDEVLREFHDWRPRLKGRCGECRFQELCGGGFRVRALKQFGDVWAEDPGCYLHDYEIAGT